MSDSYDPEWGTSAKASEIEDALDEVYHRVSGILGGKSPLDVRKLVEAELSAPITATLTEREWRLIRFALGRAGESL